MENCGDVWFLVTTLVQLFREDMLTKIQTNKGPNPVTNGAMQGCLLVPEINVHANIMNQNGMGIKTKLKNSRSTSILHARLYSLYQCHAKRTQL